MMIACINNANLISIFFLIDPLHLADGHWASYAHHYPYLASGLQGPGFPPYTLDSALTGVSSASQDSCSPTISLPGM